MKKVLIHLIIFFISLQCFAQTDTTLQIIEKPILYNKERVALSLQYLKIRHGMMQSTPFIKPKMVVLHYTAGGTLEDNFKYFNKVQIEASRKINRDESALNVSAHYLVDRDGTVYHLIADTLFARHTIGLNYCAIGIENIGSKEQPLTNKQVVSNAALIRHLCAKYKIEYVIGHSEYTKFRKTPLWKETNPKYITYKQDPGDQFLQDIRKLIAALQLKYNP
jgi:N-acetylmuramoyl-L-alanine amidase